MTDAANVRCALTNAKRVIVKVGTHSLVNKQGKPDRRRIKRLVDDLAALHKQGKEVVLVSSGAIAAGLPTLKMTRRPQQLPELQMAASVGQTRLLTIYHELFAPHKMILSQVLLTHDDLKNRTRHLNARNTLLKLLSHRVLPIINENDVVSVDEIKFGDNDVLSALVATLLGADCLILLTTANGILRPDKRGKLSRVPYLSSINAEVNSWVLPSKTSLSTGGMTSKLKAAQIALKNGIDVVIASSEKANNCQAILAGNDVGTLISPSSKKAKMQARKRWIAFFHKPQGTLVVDAGAAKAIRQAGKSLLAAGIKHVDGPFLKGALVNILDENKSLIAQGLSGYPSVAVDKIKGRRSSEIQTILGTKDYDEVIHRDNLWICDEEE